MQKRLVCLKYHIMPADKTVNNSSKKWLQLKYKKAKNDFFNKKSPRYDRG